MTVQTKSLMYKMLASGEFGNTVPQWFSLDKWEAERPQAIELWGIRSGLAGGDKRMRLNVPTVEVAGLYREWFPSDGGNISPMIDMYAILRAEVWEADISPCGLMVYFADGYDPADPWRGSFRKYGRTLQGIQALTMLQRHLWPNDLEDLRLTLERFPGHVVELSACSRAVGVIPHRNTIVWEVRNY